MPRTQCSVEIAGLGCLTGWKYDNGVRQFCGIPYATLQKRWTRSKLCTSWLGGQHDGRNLGARMPHPEFEEDDIDDLTPVPPLPHLPYPEVDERQALVMNIALPPQSAVGPHPIMVYVHGGSLLYGGAHLAIFDAVSLVAQSVTQKRPIVVVNFNYRVGFGGFLASKCIAQELAREGHQGCGNFGLTDQRVAFEWVSRYCSALGGDIDNIVAVGESAGGISISNQLLAKQPPVFHRAVCMSGLACSIPAWTLDQHEKQFEALCKWIDLDPGQPDVLDRLRDIPEQVLANASPGVSGVISGTGNPCLDGWFYDKDPRVIHEAPAWLDGYVIGDVYHEGVIFHQNIIDDSFELWQQVFQDHISDEDIVKEILELYDINPGLSREALVGRFEHMAGDAIFRIPNYVTAQRNKQLAERNRLFAYHFDQRSRLKNALEGTAYHAYELLYLFKGLYENMSCEERQLADSFAASFIAFTHGTEPWPQERGKRQWKLWGPGGKETVVREEDDEEVREYSRFEKMLSIGDAGATWLKWLAAIDAIVNKRWRMGCQENKSRLPQSSILMA